MSNEFIFHNKYKEKLNKALGGNFISVKQYNRLESEFSALFKESFFSNSKMDDWIYKHKIAVHEYNSKELTDTFLHHLQLEDLEKINIKSDKIVVCFSKSPIEINLNELENENDLVNVIYDLLGKNGSMTMFRVKLVISVICDIKGFNLDKDSL